MQNPNLNLLPAQRVDFHRTFLSWLASSTEGETNQLDAALTQYPGNGVRSMLKFVHQALVNPEQIQALPASLVELLRDRNWPQAEFCCEAIAVVA